MTSDRLIEIRSHIIDFNSAQETLYHFWVHETYNMFHCFCQMYKSMMKEMNAASVPADKCIFLTS